MPYQPSRKATLLIPSGSGGKPEGKHLHVILTDACKDDLHLFGSIASIYPDQFHDPTCIIKAGEHKFIKHDSYFVYRRLVTVGGNHLTVCVDGWVYLKNDPITDALYNHICDGIDKSEFTPRGIISYWTKNKPKPPK